MKHMAEDGIEAVVVKRERRASVVHVCSKACFEARDARARREFLERARRVIECVDIVRARCEVERITPGSTSEFEDISRTVFCEDAFGSVAGFARFASELIGRFAIGPIPMISLCVERRSRVPLCSIHEWKIRHHATRCLARIW